jgi:putative nucleotidyltransferase with HDIG domain
MALPTRFECLQLMQKRLMPRHIQNHSILVADLALHIGRRLNCGGARLDAGVLEAGGLLHDIAKAESLRSGVRHERLGAKILHDLDYLHLASIVQDHVSIDLIRLHGPITESLIINYADKRVKHDGIVTLEDRFFDLIHRYARSTEQEVHLRRRLDLYRTLERKIFDPLTIEPDAVEVMQLSLNFSPH